MEMKCRVHGTTIGTSTDGNGKYSIITPINGTAKLGLALSAIKPKNVQRHKEQN
jgi:hypothetical protein